MAKKIKGARFDDLRRLYELVDNIKKSHFDLGNVVINTENHDRLGDPLHCGTIACASGWCAMHPYFREKYNLGMDEDGDLCIDGEFMSFDEAMAVVFNITESQALELFSRAGGSSYDDEIDADISGPISDKKRFKLRMKKFFEENGETI